MSERCKLCASQTEVILSPTPLPRASFFSSSHESQQLFSIEMGVCLECGLVQLTRGIDPKLLIPPTALTYNEPEKHLDSVAGLVVGLAGLPSNATIGGITYKDDSTLQRLKTAGLDVLWRLDPALDLDITDARCGLETISGALTVARAKAIASRRGVVDVLMVRHILEHTNDPISFTNALRHLVSPSGYLVFEVPDTESALISCDYTTLWEEHVLYFTPPTLRSYLAHSGFPEICLKVYPSVLENSLVAIAAVGGPLNQTAIPSNLERSVSIAQGFGTNFDSVRRCTQHAIRELRLRCGALAMFGAGHRACEFINLMAIENELEFVIDDQPSKQGLFMPGTKLPILPSTTLKDRGIYGCLLSLSPESEEKVLANSANFANPDTLFVSIFPQSDRALLKTLGETV